MIYVGRLQLNGWNPNESSYRINRVVVPYGYTDPQLGKDIALVELASPVTWSDYVQPVCLPNADVSFSGGTQCTITGWGDIRDGGELGWKWWTHRLDLTLTRKDSTLTSEYFRKKLAFLLLLLLNNQQPIIFFFNVGLTHSRVYTQFMPSTHFFFFILLCCFAQTDVLKLMHAKPHITLLRKRKKGKGTPVG